MRLKVKNIGSVQVSGDRFTEAYLSVRLANISKTPSAVIAEQPNMSSVFKF